MGMKLSVKHLSKYKWCILYARVILANTSRYYYNNNGTTAHTSITSSHGYGTHIEIKGI